MRSTRGVFADTLRTFADGGFYAMNVAPGSYTLVVDPVQLQFLQVVQQNGPLSVTVHHSLQGDLIEDLSIVCESLIKTTKPAQEVDTTKVVATDTIKKIIVTPPRKKENIDSTILKEYTEPVAIPVQKENIDSTHKETAETVSPPALKANSESSLSDEYSNGVSLFRQKKYDDALTTFTNVLKKGIDKALAGNCEYWMGECQFATRNYISAIEHFQNVLSNDSSKKKPDAYFMLGRSYDQTGELEKAQTVYKELNEQYPNNVHYRRVLSRLDALQRLIDEKRKVRDEIQK